MHPCERCLGEVSQINALLPSTEIYMDVKLVYTFSFSASLLATSL